MNWIFYGLIFITVGVVKMVRDAKRNRPHVHRCPKCGAEWQHQVPDERDWPSMGALAAAHTCPACGTEQMEIDRFVDDVPPKKGMRAGAAGQPQRVPPTRTADQPAQERRADAPAAPAPVPVKRVAEEPETDAGMPTERKPS